MRSLRPALTRWQCDGDTKIKTRNGPNVLQEINWAYVCSCSMGDLKNKGKAQPITGHQGSRGGVEV
jgi:hypothetical protein